MELLITHCVNNLWDSWPQMVRKCTTCWASSYTSSIGTSFSTTISTSSRGFMQKAQMSTGQLKAHSHNWWASSRMSKNFKSLKTWESSASPSGFFKTVVLSTWLKVKFLISKALFSHQPQLTTQWSFTLKKLVPTLIVVETFWDFTLQKTVLSKTSGVRKTSKTLASNKWSTTRILHRPYKTFQQSLIAALTFGRHPHTTITMNVPGI